MAALSPTEKLVELLVQENKSVKENLESLLLEFGDSEEDLVRSILDQKLISEDEVYAQWAKALGVAFIRLERENIQIDAVKTIPQELCEAYHMIPTSLIGKELTVAMANPLDMDAIDAMESRGDYSVLPVMAAPARIQDCIDQAYMLSEGLDAALKKIDLHALDDATLADPIKLAQVAGEDALVHIVDFMLSEAIKESASDIHIEPRPDHLQVRYRIDGILRDMHKLPSALTPPIVSRIKILADLDIAEKRKPLDGRIKYRAGRRDVEFRVSTLPTVSGEKVVARILDQSKVILEINDLGFSKVILDQIKQLIQAPHGIILVTGPTGSGKTTSLYGMLSEINSPDLNIVTVEDPVEYSIPLINQVQVNVKAGRTFANALRSILRQDPDVVMIGEIRDPETAGIAVQAALTGHLVLSTLHTNSAIQAFPRLIDIGVEPFLLAPALRGVMAQRLVRKVCPDCVEPAKPAKNILEALGFPADDTRLKFVQGRGCSRCRQTGYSGRTSIHELVVVNDEIRSLISKGGSELEIREAAIKNGYHPLSYDGIKKSILGLTTVEEVARVCMEQ